MKRKPVATSGEREGAGQDRDGGQERQTIAENGHGLGQTLGDSEGQGGLACCGPWGHKESNMTGLLNNNKNILRSVKSIATVERDWAQLQIQQRQLGTYSQKAEWRESQWTENY